MQRVAPLGEPLTSAQSTVKEHVMKDLAFEYEGVRYELEFDRVYKAVRVGYDPEREGDQWAPSKYPYTTVCLWRSQAGKVPGELFRTGTVGAHFKENKPFTKEEGRRAALRFMCKGKDLSKGTEALSKGLKAAMWACYLNRGKGA